MSGLVRLAEPRLAAVRAGPGGAPVALDRAAVEAVVEDWVVEDRWWTGRPLRRRYFELVLEGGRNAVVFCDLADGRWYLQRA
ncbi:MAG: hypothetical protein H0W05_08510 [Thermoleophilaceae bacterium]|nr:hypothetical protein [Thermoleophilaceae bacterium]